MPICKYQYLYNLQSMNEHCYALHSIKIQPKYGGKIHEHIKGTEEKYFILSEELDIQAFLGGGGGLLKNGFKVPSWISCYPHTWL